MLPPPPPHGDESGEPEFDGSHDPRSDSGRPGHGAESRSNAKKLPTVEEILVQLVTLNGLVAMGMMSPSKANTIIRSLQLMLATQMKRNESGAARGTLEDLAALCKKDPGVLALISIFLTPEQRELMVQLIDMPEK